ncbi:BF3164 family lipoprotein [Algoriphagus aquimarinus]|uniref:BF3164 family lipoprotein n=1 Tax=Algoriphagus aquimarinus TaxID=237018 RepID=UPI0030DC551A|tara:strand:- start:68146 stop:69240 length:1095 start_codon:yes stop_codon:yes gene_type:complete
MKKSAIVILVLSLFSLACTNSDNKNPFILENENVYHLIGHKTYFSELLMPRHLNVVGDYLIISEGSRLSPDLPLLHVIKKNPLTYKFPKGVTGFGPFEIPDATLVEPGFSDSTFTVYSSMSKKFTDFSLRDTLRLGIKEYKQPQELFGMYRMFHATDSTVIGIMANDSNRLVEFSMLNGKRIAGYGNWEKIPNADHLIDYTDPDINYHMGEINKGRLKVNQKLGLFVKANGYRDRIEIFHYDSKTFDIVEGPRLEVPDFKIRYSSSKSAVIFNPEYPYGYGDVSIGEKYIYALYGGVTEKQIRETNEIAKIIYVLTHTGEVVGRFNLDISVADMVVDEELGKIYGITTDEDPGIAVFDIPEKFL